jgi:enterochelin esterase-like enzyme
MDLKRVGVVGWSFGGYFSALAVMRQPEVLHCAVVGAPVVTWENYDTFTRSVTWVCNRAGAWHKRLYKHASYRAGATSLGSVASISPRRGSNHGGSTSDSPR